MKTIYSQPNCPGCVALKNKLKSEGVPFAEVVIGKDLSLDTFRKYFPDVKSVPFVVEDEDADGAS